MKPIFKLGRSTMLLTALAIFSFAACQSEGEKAQDAVKKATDAARDAQEQAKKTMEEAQKVMDQGMNQMNDTMRQAQDTLNKVQVPVTTNSETDTGAGMIDEGADSEAAPE